MAIIKSIHSGIEIHSQEFELFGKQQIFYLKSKYKTKILNSKGSIFQNQDFDNHLNGFSCPVGNLVDSNKAFELFNEEDLKRFSIKAGEQVTLNFESSVRVSGLLKSIVYDNNNLAILTFEKPTVSSDVPGHELLFKPEWGVFDMVVISEYDYEKSDSP